MFPCDETHINYECIYCFYEVSCTYNISKIQNYSRSLNGPQREKTCLQRFANNKSADQPVHPGSLISAFIICLLESIIYLLALSEMLLFWVVSVAKETGLSLSFSETPKKGFLASRPKSKSCHTKSRLVAILLLVQICIFKTGRLLKPQKSSQVLVTVLNLCLLVLTADSFCKHVGA